MYNGRNVLTRNGQYFSERLLWVGVSLGIIFGILYYTPFPASVPIAIGAFFILNFYFRKKVVKRMNMMYGNSASGIPSSSSSSSSTSSSLSYSCISCRTRHNDATCPDCGSKMKKAEFYTP
jgi:hypothetical protein